MFALVSTAHADRCTPPRQPPGIGNSLMTWTRPNDCPLSKDETATKRWCKTCHRVTGRVCAGDGPICAPEGYAHLVSHHLARHAGGHVTRQRPWLRGGPRWLLLRSGACQRLSTFSINSRNSAILAARFAASRVPETAGGDCRLRPTLVISTSLHRCVIVCGPHHRLIQLSAARDTPVLFLVDHTNRID
jgi:hypothetical protein